MTVTLWEHCRVSWMCVSTGLVVLNKYLLSNVGFCYPMALSGMGMAFSSVASFIACKVSGASLPTHSCCGVKVVGALAPESWPSTCMSSLLQGAAGSAPACLLPDLHQKPP